MQISTPFSDAIVQTAAKETKSLRSDVIRAVPEPKSNKPPFLHIWSTQVALCLSFRRPHRPARLFLARKSPIYLFCGGTLRKLRQRKRNNNMTSELDSTFWGPPARLTCLWACPRRCRRTTGSEPSASRSRRHRFGGGRMDKNFFFLIHLNSLFRPFRDVSVAMGFRPGHHKMRRCLPGLRRVARSHSNSIILRISVVVVVLRSI